MKPVPEHKVGQHLQSTNHDFDIAHFTSEAVLLMNVTYSINNVRIFLLCLNAIVINSNVASGY